MRLLNDGAAETRSSLGRRSLWLDELRAQPQEQLASSDPPGGGVVIVGGGFVGLWAAIEIRRLDPSMPVTVLEAGRCGHGASGLNGGFVMSWWPKIASLAKVCGLDDALWLADETTRAIEDLPRFLESHGVDAEYRQAGWLWTATTPAHIGAWAGVVRTAARLGRAAVFQEVDPKDLQHRTGSAAHLAGICEPINGTVHPGKLGRGLARIATSMGVNIQEQTPVIDIDLSRPAVLTTPRGRFGGDRVVIATNAWAAGIRALRRRFVCVGSAVVATAPMPQRLQEIGWTGGESITDSQATVTYYRTTRSGRIVFGKGGGRLYYTGTPAPETFMNAGGIAEATADFRRVYPMLADVPIEHHWSGPIDRTYDSLPLLGVLAGAEHVCFGVGWSGNGVNPSRIGGRVLAGLALDRRDRWTSNGLVNRQARRFPPEPLRYVGGSMVRAAMMRKDQAEVRGEKPSFVDRALASLAPAGLEDKE